mmetsp:Transcript_78471/g.123750  ORF Transcript_78471/g.123750 Transcript_78471/m.123750 type:complete len:232 (+) Transcript_78471:37-732(+)
MPDGSPEGDDPAVAMPLRTPAQPVPDAAFVALCSLLEARGKGTTLTYEEAADVMLQAHNTHRKETKGRPRLTFLCLVIGGTILFCMVLLLLLLLTRALFTEIGTSDGLLRANGADQANVAAVAAALQVRSLASSSALPANSLQNIRDVSLVHRGIWRCLHISSVVKFSDVHVWLEAADGSAIRLWGSKVFLRQGWLGDEEVINASETFMLDGGNWSQEVAPTAVFDLVLNE